MKVKLVLLMSPLINAYLELVQVLLLASDVCGQDERTDLPLKFHADVLIAEEPAFNDAAHRRAPVMVFKHRRVLRK